MQEKIKIISPVFFIRSKTNVGEHAKQYFITLKSATSGPALVIRKLILTSEPENYKILKKYKSKYLIEIIFSIKLATLNVAIKTINDKPNQNRFYIQNNL